MITVDEDACWEFIRKLKLDSDSNVLEWLLEECYCEKQSFDYQELAEHYTGELLFNKRHRLLIDAMQAMLLTELEGWDYECYLMVLYCRRQRRNHGLDIYLQYEDNMEMIANHFLNTDK